MIAHTAMMKAFYLDLFSRSYSVAVLARNLNLGRNYFNHSEIQNIVRGRRYEIEQRATHHSEQMERR